MDFGFSWSSVPELIWQQKYRLFQQNRFFSTLKIRQITMVLLINATIWRIFLHTQKNRQIAIWRMFYGLSIFAEK